MNWAKLIKKNFDSATVGRGQGYWQQGRVRSVEWMPGGKLPTIVSQVKGSAGNYNQTIRIDFDREEIDGNRLVGGADIVGVVSCSSLYADDSSPKDRGSSAPDSEGSALIASSAATTCLQL